MSLDLLRCQLVEGCVSGAVRRREADDAQWTAKSSLMMFEKAARDREACERLTGAATGDPLIEEMNEEFKPPSADLR